ncbi:MAG TPA: sulfatase [Polyangiales bacterium]|nr:sulfatase [Polyangiales bacterium]
MRLYGIVIVSCASCLAACHTGVTSSRSAQAEHDRVVAPVIESEHQKAGSPVPAPLPATAPKWRVHYALAPALARAEMRRGDTQLFDFGEPGDAKYSLGGWLTLTAADEPLEGERALVVRGKSAKLFLPLDNDDMAGPSRMSLRVRSFSSTTMSLYVAGKKVGERKLGGDAFESFHWKLGAGVLRPGDNAIELRVARGNFALDFIELTAASSGDKITPPPAASELAPAPDQLYLPDGISLAYTLEVPAGAELHVNARSIGDARLRISAARDRTRRVELASVELTGGTGSQVVRVPLSALEGDLAQIELRASGSAISLDHPTIVEPARSPAYEKKPIRNVIVMLIDTLRADKLKNYNPQSRVRTPGLARFLADAVTMKDARTQECWTKPSVATLLSSLFPWQHNAFSDSSRVPESVELLPEYFGKRGFRTAAFIANGYVSDKFGFGQGWDDYRNYIRENRRSIAQEVAADVLQWLDARPQQKPFFLYVHTIDPHVPYRPPKSFLSMYDPDPYGGPVDFSRTNELLEQIKIGKLPLNARDKVRLEALYDGEISYHDVHFAAILDGLDKRGLRDDTMVVVTADHGEEFWDHGSVGHGHSNYDELLHIPLMVRIPGLTDGNAVLRGNVGLVDIAPTILDAMGLPIPDTMYGRSFLPELRGEGPAAPRASVSQFMSGIKTVASGRYKLIQRGLDQPALYDLSADPHETRDLTAERPLALRYTRGLLGLTMARSTSGKTTRVYKRESTTIDRETEAQLRALGYVGSSRP